MADYSSASITIGGALSRALLPALLAAIAEDHLCTDYSGKLIEEDDIVSGTTLAGAAYDVRGAMFEATEAFCRQHALRYVRRSDACAGVWDAGIETFTGVGSPHNLEANIDGAVVLTLAQIHRLGSLEAIEVHCAPAAFDPGSLVIIDGD